MKRILVPTDFSACAGEAFQVALDLAARTKATLHLVHVIELPVLYNPLLTPGLSFEAAFRKELQEIAIGQLESMTRKNKKSTIPVTLSVKFGAVQETLDNYIIDHKIDQVIMGSHGAKGAREVFLGSRAEKMIRYSGVPVLIVKANTKKLVSNIVVPCMLNVEDQLPFLNAVKNLQTVLNAKLHLVWINTALNFTSDIISRERLNYMASKAGLKNFTVTAFSHSDEEEGILRFSREVQGDLIAIGTHARKGVSHLLLGSLAEDIANHGPMLVWTTPQIVKQIRKTKRVKAAS